MQRAANAGCSGSSTTHPKRLDDAIGLGRIDWRSPLRSDDYAEYRDQSFLDLLGVDLQTRPLRSFWPVGGPQWDGLGWAASGEVVLVEAKARLNELDSPATGASESSLMQIQSSLSEDGQWPRRAPWLRLVEAVLPGPEIGWRTRTCSIS